MPEKSLRLFVHTYTAVVWCSGRVESTVCQRGPHSSSTDVAAETLAQCDHLHGGDLVIGAGGVQYARTSWQLLDEMRQQGLKLSVITYAPEFW